MRRTLVVAAVVALMIGASARAQTPTMPSTTPPADFTNMVGGPETFSEPTFAPPAPAVPSYYAGEGSGPTGPRVEMSFFGTIADSLFGDVYAEGRWRPLSLGTFFSEGWLEPWAGAPAGQEGLTPRHGWLGAFDGVFYRLWLTIFSYSHNLNTYSGLSTPYGGNRFRGDYAIFLPFSRRFELLIDVPFVVSNGTINNTRGYRQDVGDLIIAPRFLLSETAATSQVLALGIQAPTGSHDTGGRSTALFPRYEFWNNPFGAWEVRGATGFLVPLNKAETPAQTKFNGNLAVGRVFRPHDVAFGDLVFYVSSNLDVPLDGASKRTYLGIGPGTRFHITNNYFFLNYWEFPVTGPRAFEYNMQFALLKVF